MRQDIKPNIAFFDFAGCEGCQLTVIDSLQRHPTLLDAVEIVQFREAMSEKSDKYQIAFIEGSCTRLKDEMRLKSIREKAEYVIALGACAHLGGVNALRNWQSQEEVERYVYGSRSINHDPYPGAPIETVIPIDGFIPGCPIDREEFINCVTALLQGRRLPVPDYPLCVECKLLGNVCVFNYGKSCLGPITRAGCGAICPKFGVGCDGCRGKTSSANIKGMQIAMSEHGFDNYEYSSKIKLFQSYQLSPNKRDQYGNQKPE